MANVALFEDNESTIWAIKELYLAGTDHEIVAEAKTDIEAFGVFRRLFARHVQADVMLLDGHLMHEKNEEFEFTSEIGKPLRVSSANRYKQGSHAEMVQYINTASGLRIPTIGISSLPMREQEVGPIDVTIDLTKDRLAELPDIIDQLVSQK